jgi:hypothetical protein
MLKYRAMGKAGWDWELGIGNPRTGLARRSCAQAMQAGWASTEVNYWTVNLFE